MHVACSTIEIIMLHHYLSFVQICVNLVIHLFSLVTFTPPTNEDSPALFDWNKNYGRPRIGRRLHTHRLYPDAALHSFSV